MADTGPHDDRTSSLATVTPGNIEHHRRLLRAEVELCMGSRIDELAAATPPHWMLNHQEAARDALEDCLRQIVDEVDSLQTILDFAKRSYRARTPAGTDPRRVFPQHPGNGYLFVYDAIRAAEKRAVMRQRTAT
jgi:hypothetical protein